jgi:fibronectin-binding autotransporter adhesin
MPARIVTNGVILRVLGGNMRKFKRRQRHSLPFWLFLAVVGALLLPAALAPRANAQSSGTNLDAPLANSSWTGAVSTDWGVAGNWTAGIPGAADIAFFDSNFTSANQPNLSGNKTVGEVNMTSTVTQNVTIINNTLTLNGVAGTGIQLDNSAFTLTIDSNVTIGNTQNWINNSTLAGNSLTVSGPVNLNNNALTISGVGNTLVSAAIVSGGGSVVINSTGTTTFSGTNTYDGGTTVNAGTLLITGNSGGADGLVTVNSGGTLGGNNIAGGNNGITVNSGGNLSPGVGGNTTAVLTNQGQLTLQAGSNFRIDINGAAVGTGYDQLVSANAVTLNNGNLLVHVGTTLSVGQTFTILNKTSGGAIVGTFAGAPQGGTVVGDDGTVFQITYTGGTGNDVVLTVIQAAVPEPSTYIGGALAIAGLAFTQRRRLKRLIAFSR